MFYKTRSIESKYNPLDQPISRFHQPDFGLSGVVGGTGEGAVLVAAGWGGGDDGAATGAECRGC